jgi:hypothetical protein
MAADVSAATLRKGLIAKRAKLPSDQQRLPLSKCSRDGPMQKTFDASWRSPTCSNLSSGGDLSS